MKEGDDRSGHPLLSFSKPFGPPPLGLPLPRAERTCTRILRSWTLGRKGVALSASPFKAHLAALVLGGGDLCSQTVIEHEPLRICYTPDIA